MGRAANAPPQFPMKNVSMRGRLRLSLPIFLLVLVACGAGPTRPLKPSLPTPTAGALVIKPEARLVAFEELAANPRLFLNSRLQVSGSLTRLALPVCAPYKGPALRWALVAQNLQLNAFGYDAILQLAEEGEILTVEGVWQFYDGPLGCGKEPSRTGLWYLAVTRIVQPNPLARGGAGGGVTPVAAEPTDAINAASATTALDATPTPGGDFGPPSVTLTPSLTPTPINVAPPTGAPSPDPSPTPTSPPRATQPIGQPTPTPSATPIATPVAPGTPTVTSLPTLPSGPGTPGGCGYPPGDDCKTTTPYP